MPADTWGVVAELAALRHGVTTRTQAASLGLTARHIRRALTLGTVDEPIPGVLWFRSHPPTWRQRLAVVTAAGGDHAVVSHRAAGRLHVLIDGTPTPEVSTLRSRRLRLPDGISAITHHVASLDRSDVVQVHGLPTTGLARTLVDLGSVTDHDTVWRALIEARRQHVDPRWLAATARRLHRPGQAGSGTLLRALRRWESEGVLPDSWLEELLHRIVNDPSLPPVVRQCPIRDEAGHLVARTDLGFPDVRLGLEGHSRRFHFGPDAEAADEDRDLRAAACGWELVYLGWYATKRPAHVLDRIRRVIDRRLAA